MGWAGEVDFDNLVALALLDDVGFQWHGWAPGLKVGRDLRGEGGVGVGGSLTIAENDSITGKVEAIAGREIG